MATATINFFSNSLMRNVSVNVIVPVDKYDFNGVNCSRKQPFKTLYLLHGIFGDYTDWITGTRIVSWAMERDLAVVMPSGDNHFYVDSEGYGARYGEFIGKELVDITRRMFPLSDKREDTFIGGLSMGGYGAVINGLKYSDTFGSIIALSSALHVVKEVPTSTNDVAGIIGRRDYYESIFGDLSKIEGSDRDYCELIRRLKAAGKPVPKIYMACGTEDFLIEANREYRDFLIENDVEVSYHESPGVHNWIFWDEYIHKALDWLPLGEVSEGVNSGNVQ